MVEFLHISVHISMTVIDRELIRERIDASRCVVNGGKRRDGVGTDGGVGKIPESAATPKNAGATTCCVSNRHFSMTTTDTGMRLASIASSHQDLSRSFLESSASFFVPKLEAYLLQARLNSSP